MVPMWGMLRSVGARKMVEELETMDERLTQKTKGLG